MKKNQSRIIAVAAAFAMVAFSGTYTYAGSWQQDNIGWWWQEDDGSYPVNTWKWIDGNGDGVAECYCFDNRGYMYSNTVTPDGYTVNVSGAWVSNGSVQEQKVSNQSKQHITEDEACQIACDYWNVTPDLKETFVSASAINSREGNEKKYYQVRLSWRVDNHLSTIDMIYVDGETGECLDTVPR